MDTMRRAVGLAIAAPLVLALSGCSVDTLLLWGEDGADVIATSDRLIAAAAAGDAASFVCEGRSLDLRDPADWRGLSAEEPERFTGDHWKDQIPLEPSWSINLSLPEDRIAAGTSYPGDLFYRSSDDGLCLVDIAWSTVQ